MKNRILIAFALLSAVTFCLPARAEDAGDIRHRIEQRLPQIDALKAQEFVGENNRGLLEERKAGGPDAATAVADENRDREAVYAYIAKQTGANSESVARARAKQISAKSPHGVWVQDEAGRWFKK